MKSSTIAITVISLVVIVLIIIFVVILSKQPTTTQNQPFNNVTLSCRMLGASVSAYLVDENGNFTPPAPGTNKYYDLAGWIGTPKVITGKSGFGNQKINVALVGNTINGVVVSFRGTLPFKDPMTFQEVLDWTQDLLILPYSNATISTWGENVKVHPGIWDAVQSISPQIQQELNNLQPEEGKLFFTGHSKGAGMSSIEAVNYAYPNDGQVLPTLYTFASPRVGNQAFADSFNSTGMKQYNYQNYQDIVPLLPPSPDDITNILDPLLKEAERTHIIDPIWYSTFTSLLNDYILPWDYVSVGEGIYINQFGNLGPTNQNVQWSAVFSALASGGFEQVKAAHCLTCPSEPNCQGNYMVGVCGSNQC